MQVSKRDIQWLQNAFELSKSHDSGGKYNICALVVKGSSVLTVGWNAYPHIRAGETYSDEYEGLGCHAELHALSNNVDVEKATLYIAGSTSFRTSITSKPCPRCNNLLINSRIAKVCFYNILLVPKIIRVRDLEFQETRAIKKLVEISEKKT